jgi:hypothetical protein
MTTAEATELVALALAAYPTQASRIRDSAVAGMRAMWADLLDDLDFGVVKAALLVHCKSAKFLPSPAELREIASSGGKGQRSGFEAWGDVLAVVRRVGRYREPRFTDPAVAQAVQAIGWREICDSENPEATRAHFARAYESAAAESRRTGQIGQSAIGKLREASSTRAQELVAGVAGALEGRQS